MVNLDAFHWRLQINSLYKFDLELSKKYDIICGVDEVGRGPLAGPVYASAVIFKAIEIDGINDSKKLTPKKRENLFNKIVENQFKYSIGISTVEEIEKLNILKASHLAMKRAVEALKIVPDLILVDGNLSPSFPNDYNVKNIVKGDNISYSIACASIMAKVTRDKFMIDISNQFPEYGFDKNKGYGTKSHIESIKKNGPCKIHRKLFLRNII